MECTVLWTPHRVMRTPLLGELKCERPPLRERIVFSSSSRLYSRVMAVSPSGEAMWEVIVPGIAVGTPQISGGQVYVTHNDISPENGGYNNGKVTVIRRYGLSSEIPRDVVGLFGVPLERQAPFGPLSVPIDNKMYFGESWGSGVSQFGVMYELDGTQVQGILRTDWSTVTPPTLSLDGESMWIGGSAFSVQGWVNVSFTSQPSWSITLGVGSSPIASKVIVTSDNDLLFVLTPHHQIYCLNAETGDEIWSNDGQVVSPDAMELSGDDSTLFTIGTEAGIVARFDARTGRHLATVSCVDLWADQTCTMPVEGAFSVSNDAAKLIFGDSTGAIVALDVGVVDEPLSPTLAPTNVLVGGAINTGDLPAHSPSELDFSAPSSSSLPSLFPSTSPSASPPEVDLSALPSQSSGSPSITLAPVSPAPITFAPLSSSPSHTFAPVLPAPITFAPLSPSPSDTFAPVLPAPITSTPVASVEDFSAAPAAVAPSSPAYSPAWTPAMTPAMTPSDFVYVNPAGVPVASPVAVDADPAITSVPSLGATEGSVTTVPSLENIEGSVTDAPSVVAIDLVEFETDLDTMSKASRAGQSKTNSAGYYVALVGVVLAAMAAVLSVGILTGRLWQSRRDQSSFDLIQQDKLGEIGNKGNVWSYFEKRLQEMN